MSVIDQKLNKYFNDKGKFKEKIFTRTEYGLFMPHTEDNLNNLNKLCNGDKFLLVDKEKKVIGLIKEYPKKEWYSGNRYRMHAKFKDKKVEGFPISKEFVCTFCKWRMRNATEKCKPGIFNGNGLEKCQFRFIEGDFSIEKINLRKLGYEFISPAYVCSEGPFFTSINFSNISFDEKVFDVNKKSLLERAKTISKTKERENSHVSAKMSEAVDSELEKMFEEINNRIQEGKDYVK